MSATSEWTIERTHSVEAEQGSAMLAITLTIIGTLIFASIFEGLLHQFILHTDQKSRLKGLPRKAFIAHAVEHHPAYREDNYKKADPVGEKKVSLEWYTLPLTLIFFSPLIWGIWSWLGMGSGIAMILTIITYYVAYETLHWNMHFPRKDGQPRFFFRFWPFRAYFEWFDKRHYVHHQADDRNFNVVLPFYDLMTGRYTTREEDIPWAIRLRTKRNMKKSQRIREKIAAGAGGRD